MVALKQMPDIMDEEEAQDEFTTHKLEAERAVLGASLLESYALGTAIDAKLTALDFYNVNHQIIYHAMLALSERDVKVDLITLSDELERRGDLATIGGDDALTVLANDALNIDNIDSYVNIVRDRARRRRVASEMQSTAIALAKAASRGDVSVIDGIHERLALVKQEEAQQRLSSYHFTSITDPIPKPDWLIGRTFMRDTTAGIFGESEAGKSLVALHMTLHIAAGWEWEGMPTRQGHVIYIAAEGKVGVIYRLRALCQQYDMPIEKIAPFIHILGEAVPLLKPDRVQDFCLLLEQTQREHCTFSPLQAVFFDTLTRHMEGGEENNNDDMRDALNATDLVRRQFHVTAINVHHAGKNGMYRGASNYKGCLDTLIEVSQADGIVKVHCEKQKDGAPKFADKHFTIDSVPFDDDYSAPVLMSTATQIECPTNTLRGRAAEAMTIFCQQFSERGASLSEWMNAGNFKKPTLISVIQELHIQRRYVEHRGEGRGSTYHITPQGRAWYERYENGMIIPRHTDVS